MVLVTGATGFVGQKLMQMLPGAVACPSLRNATGEDVRRMVEESGADVIIHTAAISDIGACAKDPEASYAANVQLPVYLAGATKGAKLICFSSDQVYSGLEEEGPYREDTVKPGNLYACQKLEMEQRVLEIDPGAVMLRAQWMYDWYLKKSNYFMQIIRSQQPLSFSSRQFRGVAYVKEVAENMEKVMGLPGGAYNFGSETEQSMYAITEGFLAALGKDTPLAEGPVRHNLWLNCDKAKSRGVVFSRVEDGLLRCARDYGLL